MPDAKPLSASELAEYTAWLDSMGTDVALTSINNMPLITARRLLATIKWLQGERDAWEREAEAHEETVADGDAKLERLQAELIESKTMLAATGQVAAGMKAELLRARELYERLLWMYENYLVPGEQLGMDEYDAEIVKVGGKR